MKFLTSFDFLEEIPNPVLTIGTFDGVHIGHQKIIQQLNDEAEKLNGQSVLLTFFPHPRMVLNPTNHGLKLLQTQEEKLLKLSKYGLENIIVIPFNQEFANLSAEAFVKKYLVEKLKVKKLVIGYDHQFGKNREGGIEFLNSICDKYNFTVNEIPAQEINEVNISSTRIRNAIESGDILKANKYLGEPFTINGTVIKGEQLGRKIGFPTANIYIGDETKIIPSKGVYVVSAKIENGEVLHGMMNIGIRPTVSNSLNSSIEVNLFDFNKDIYSKQIEVSILSRIREEQKFENVDALINQLKNDEKICRDYFQSLTV